MHVSRGEYHKVRSQCVVSGRESTAAPMAKAKQCSESDNAMSLQSLSPFSVIPNRWSSLTEELAWSMNALSSVLATLLRASIASLLLVALGYSCMVAMTSSVGFSFL